MTTKGLNQDDVKSSSKSPNDSSQTMTSNFNFGKTKKKTIGCWYIGNTIICNKYCWIKQGIDIKCGKIAALKCINRYNSIKYDKDACKKLQQEITVLKNLKHPNIVRLYS